MNQLILYTTEDGLTEVQLRADKGTVWLSQRQMAELFDVSTDNVGLHLKNLYEDGELIREATTEESSVVQTEGGQEVRCPLTLYNLDAILAVGYRVRSPRGVHFRRWASTVLKEYLLKGFAMDDLRLKNPDGRPDYFDEMLERIRDIRASEKRFYQKVRDLLSLASDTLNRLVVIFLETAELRAIRQTVTTMDYWRENVGKLIVNNGFPLLEGAGSVSHATMEDRVDNLFQDYDQRRKIQEAQKADQEDEVDLKAIEEQIKHRKGKLP